MKYILSTMIRGEPYLLATNNLEIHGACSQQLEIVHFGLGTSVLTFI